MQINKIDKAIAEKLNKRELQPSVSAWERLSNQLDEQETKQNKKWLVYVGYAASIIVLISTFIFINQKEEIKPTKNIIVSVPLDTIQLKNIEDNTAPKIEEAIADVTEDLEKIKEKRNSKKSVKKHQVILKEFSKEAKEKTIIAQVEHQEEIIEKDTFSKVDMQKTKMNSKEGIHINADDLLYAVTHSPEEVKTYYAKYNINRKDVIDTIQKQLIKSNLKIDPETILAEVENDIEEADFQQNFMQKFKLKLSDVIVAIADRNK
ncbi:hypothetical protein C7447_102424 [Tenacibaculum adriaticum]|uniref:Uncharacterized protein n=1 Tax=Tenacibaculum adriaticum TaxID=413713 RepID=A0A5S5DVN4_9FLAO|nr:hypothetical protein [Tenacibaculum adriaticum]TYP99106.1 hypothetical protein C7447_102424 [Tenacibaculum adriaticum]